MFLFNEVKPEHVTCFQIEYLFDHVLEFSRHLTTLVRQKRNVKSRTLLFFIDLLIFIIFNQA